MMKSEELKSQAKKLDLEIQLMECNCRSLPNTVPEEEVAVSREKITEKKAQLSRLNELVVDAESSERLEEKKKKRMVNLELGKPVIEAVKSSLDSKKIDSEIKVDEDCRYIRLTTKVATVTLEPSYFTSNTGSWHRYTVEKPRIELKSQLYDERTRYYTSMDVENTPKKIVKVIEKRLEKLVYKEKRQVDEESYKTRLAELAAEWFGDKAKLDSGCYISGYRRGGPIHTSRPIINVETKGYANKIQIYNVDEEKGTATIEVKGTFTIEEAKRLALDCSGILKNE